MLQVVRKKTSRFTTFRAWLLSSKKSIPDHAMHKILVLIMLIGAFYLSTIRAGQDWGDDFAMYIHHAKNIALGIDYSNTGYIYDSQYPILGPTAYPPVFPLLLAGAYKVMGLNLTAMKVEVILLFLFSLLAIALVLKDELPPEQLLLLVALIGFNPFFWDFKDSITSDLPFLLFLYLSLFLISRTHEKQESWTFWNAVLTGVLIWIAYGTRTVGVCLVAALWLRDAVRLRKLSRFSIVATAVFLAGVAVEMHFVRGGGSYLDQFHNAPGLVAHAVTYLKSFSVLWDNGHSKLLRTVVLGLVSIPALIGFGLRLKKKVTIFEAFFIVYALTLLAWPSSEDRYIIPLVPLYLFYALIGLNAATATLSPPQRKAVFSGMMIVIALSYAGKYSTLDYGALNGIDSPAAQGLFRFAKTETKPRDIFIFIKPRAFALFTDRSTSAYHPVNNYRELWNYFCQVHAVYLIDGALDEKYPPPGARGDFLDGFVAHSSGDLRVAYSNAEFKVYRITRVCDAGKASLVIGSHKSGVSVQP